MKKRGKNAKPFFCTTHCLIGFGILAILLVTAVILWPRLRDWVTREHKWTSRQLVIDGTHVKLDIDYSKTRGFGDRRFIRIGGGGFLYRTIVTIDGSILADVTTVADPVALWHIDGKWYLIGYQLSPAQWYILRLDGGGITTRVLRTSLPTTDRAWNLVGPNAQFYQDWYTATNLPG